MNEKIFKEGKKFISFLQNIRQTIGQTNLFKNNIKILNNHTSWISHLSQLRDGRLISSSYDCTLNIYKKDTFELQLSIKEHSNSLEFFTQISNDKIITCSYDKTIKKLIGEKNIILSKN